MKWDAGSKTAIFELQAGPFTFNGFSSGGGTLTLPPNANVVINFINKDGTPHSAEVIPGEGAIPNQAEDPAIPRAYTTKVLEGLPQEGSDNMQFTGTRIGHLPHLLRGARTWPVRYVDLDEDRSRGQDAEFRGDQEIAVSHESRVTSEGGRKSPS